MRNLNHIFKIITKENIILEEINLTSSNIEGIYFKVPDLPPTIGINKSIVNDSKKYISTLSEELGHYFTTSGDLIENCKTYNEKLFRNKKEKKAKLWASDFLISDEEFVQALNNCIISIYEMADHFNVTEEMIQCKISSIILDEPKYTNIRDNFKKREIPYLSCVI